MTKIGKNLLDTKVTAELPPSWSNSYHPHVLANLHDLIYIHTIDTKHTVVKCRMYVTHIVPITLGAECSDNHIFVATFADSLNLDLSLKWVLDLFLF